MRQLPTIYVVDDDDDARHSLQSLLSANGFSVDCFESSAAFLKKIDSLTHGCLIVDLCMPEMGGLELQERLQSTGQVMPTVVLTGYGDVPSTVRAMQLGAIDVLEKPYDPAEVVERVNTLAQRAVEEIRQKANDDRLRKIISELSEREREVCQCLVRGLSAKQIAYELRVSNRTAQLHRERVLSKLGFGSVAELVREGDRIGLCMSQEQGPATDKSEPAV